MSKYNNGLASFSVQISDAKFTIRQTVSNVRSLLDAREIELIDSLDQIEEAYMNSQSNIMKDISILEETRERFCNLTAKGSLKSVVDDQMCKLTLSLRTKSVKVDILPNLEEFICGFVTIKVEENSRSVESKAMKTRSRTSIIFGEEKPIPTPDLSTELETSLEWTKVAITAASQGVQLQKSRQRRIDGSPLPTIAEKSHILERSKACSFDFSSKPRKKMTFSFNSSPSKQTSYRDMEVMGYSCSKGSKFGQISNGYGLAIDSINSRVYVCDFDNNCVQVFFENLQPAFVIYDSKISRHKKLSGPWGIDIEGSRVYVTQNKRDCINVYNLEGKFLTQFGKEGSGSGELRYPQGISVDSSHNVFVCDNGNCRIQVFCFDSKKYHFLMEIGEAGDFTWPRDIYAKRHHLYILDSMSPCLQVWSKDGSFLRKFISTGPGQDVDNPLFFTLDEEGNILISDSGHSVIRVFKPEGEVSAFIGRFGDCIGYLKSPRGLALFPNGGVVVVDEKDYPMLQCYN